MFLSIIIPVYNVENYLRKCLESIMEQKLDNMEIIIIDDGSTDASGEICEEYKGKNVIVKHKKNGGLSSARNYGLEFAKGDYIWFIDSDDFIEKDCTNTIVEKLKENKPDLMIIKSRVINENNESKDELFYSIKEGLYSNYEYMKILKNNPKSILFCAQYHIVKKDIIEKNKILFKDGIIHEDELWTPQIIMASNSIYYSNLNIYYHLMRSDSIMHSSKIEKSGNSDLIVAEELYKIYKNNKNRDLDYLKDRCTNIFLQSVWKIPDFFKKNKIKRFVPFNNSYYLKTKIKALLFLMSPRLYRTLHKLIKN